MEKKDVPEDVVEGIVSDDLEVNLNDANTEDNANENQIVIENNESQVSKQVSDDIVASGSDIEKKKYSVVVYWLTDMKLKNSGNGGTYNYSFDTFLIEDGEEFNIPDVIPCEIEHSSCDQVYTLVGFTTENQKDVFWKGADYAGGEKTLEKNFIVNSDMEVYAVYDAKYTYISSLVLDEEISYKTTTIPNKAIKNICLSEEVINKKNDDNGICYYRIKNNVDNKNYMFTKDSSVGAPIKLEGFDINNFIIKND